VQTFPQIFDLVTHELVDLGAPPDSERIAQLISAKKYILSEDEFRDLASAVGTELIGLGQLNALITPQVTDVVVNGPDAVWVDSGSGLELHKNVFKDADDVAFLARRLASLANARLDDAHPFVDGRLPNGVRLHALLPPIAGTCAKISLRFPNKRTISISDWQASLDDADKKLLQGVVAGELSFVIAGDTGCGKTTLLKSILRARPNAKRILILEEAAEIEINQPNIVSLVARSANPEGNGEVSLQYLVRQSLRMRPDSIVIGEVRGIEILDFLLAISSGHAGSGTTIHAKVGGVEKRIELLARLANVEREFAHDLFKSNIDVVIYCERSSKGRRIAQVMANRGC
jgi:pilus assembly protein CpaF